MTEIGALLTIAFALGLFVLQVMATFAVLRTARATEETAGVCRSILRAVETRPEG